MFRRFLFFTVCFSVHVLSACGIPARHYVLVDQYLVQEEYEKADNFIEGERGKYGDRNEVLYLLDRGMTLHLAGRYKESNQFLEKAEDRIDRLYTKSVTNAIGAMLTNDNTLPYEGEDFEKVMINTVSALNYVYLDLWDDALVEARKVDHKLNVINDRYDKKNVYNEDAFARYLSGILFEAKGEINDAFIAYRKAYEIYKVYKKDYGTPLPPILPGDLLRVTEALGLGEELRFYRKAFPNTRWESVQDLKGKGELIFLSYDGLSPLKVDFFIDAPIPDGQDGIYILRVALPKFVSRRTDLGYTEIHLINQEGQAVSQRTFLVEDINAIAKKNLEDRIGRITVKAIARATSKHLAARTAEKEASDAGGELAGQLVGFLSNVYSVATEQSDRRSWQTLPGQFRMARLSAPPGLYTVKIEYYSQDHQLIIRKQHEIKLSAGQKVFMSQRVIGSPASIKGKGWKKK